jgi:hypothetical protein
MAPPPARRCERGTGARGVAQPYLGARAADESGDKMADGGEPRRMDAAARSFQDARSGERRQGRCRSEPRTSIETGGSAHRWARSGRRLRGGGGRRPGVVAEAAQRVVAAARQLARDRQGGECQLTPVSAPRRCGQDAPRSGVTIGRSSTGSDAGLVVGDQPAAGERPSVGSGHACGVVGTSWLSSRWARRKLRPVMSRTVARCARRSSPALARSGSPNSSAHSSGARLLVSAMAPFS